MSIEELFSLVKDHFLLMKDVKAQGNSLKFKRKMFVMLSKGNFVIRLPNERVETLLNSGEGFPYDPGTGKQMKEWVIIPLEFKDKWIEYTEEAKAFAQTLAK